MPPPLEQYLMHHCKLRYREAHDVVAATREELGLRPSNGLRGNTSWDKELFTKCLARCSLREDFIAESSATNGTAVEDSSNPKRSKPIPRPVNVKRFQEARRIVTPSLSTDSLTVDRSLSAEGEAMFQPPHIPRGGKRHPTVNNADHHVPTMICTSTIEDSASPSSTSSNCKRPKKFLRRKEMALFPGSQPRFTAKNHKFGDVDPRDSEDLTEAESFTSGSCSFDLVSL